MNREQILKAAEHYSRIIEEVKGMNSAYWIEDLLHDNRMRHGLCEYMQSQGLIKEYSDMNKYRPEGIRTLAWWPYPRFGDKDSQLEALTVRRDFLLELATKLETVSA